jgi:hypothetical protein
VVGDGLVVGVVFLTVGFVVAGALVTGGAVLWSVPVSCPVAAVELECVGGLLVAAGWVEHAAATTATTSRATKGNGRYLGGIWVIEAAEDRVGSLHLDPIQGT